ncbi:t-SNARE affecting a late Golgi compartment 1 [Hyphodiscus hymeniophilus]|uniref:t-SNARE affecting a late Golgi compartment protein 1 n=1 Tax=Hyphodiscus hymeniophilus TaxID=353542 RepID=A0A9P6VEK9_9HELO|nr:t-SNARE affecting a late Golgi compartment 1 [Hyphodiscus hymeniophilus]
MMSSTNEQDPFLQVQADVLSQLQHTRPLFTSYLRIRSLASTSQTPLEPTPELRSARAELEGSLSTLAEDLSDLVESVKAVQDDPYKYGLEIEEVSRRKRLVDEVGGEVEDMREELLKTFSHSGTGGGVGGAQRAMMVKKQRCWEGTGMITTLKQDTQLDGVFRTVGNLRQQADDMGRELEEQAEMLEVVDGLADRVGSRLGTGMKKMGEVVRRNEDGLSSCCIAVLIFVLILLLVLVLVL